MKFVVGLDVVPASLAGAGSTRVMQFLVFGKGRQSFGADVCASAPGRPTKPSFFRSHLTKAAASRPRRMDE
jgi:hypothetical protein